MPGKSTLDYFAGTKSSLANQIGKSSKFSAHFGNSSHNNLWKEGAKVLVKGGFLRYGHNTFLTVSDVAIVLSYIFFCLGLQMFRKTW